MKKNVIGVTCSKYYREINAYIVLFGITEGKCTYGNLGVDGRALRHVFKHL
jgi:hypothetical protein